MAEDRLKLFGIIPSCFLGFADEVVVLWLGGGNELVIVDSGPYVYRMRLNRLRWVAAYLGRWKRIA